MSKKPEALRAGDKANFQTLLEAARHGDLALVSAVGATDQRPAALVCAMSSNADGTITPMPLAVMVQANPFELFEAPTV